MPRRWGQARRGRTRRDLSTGRGRWRILYSRRVAGLRPARRPRLSFGARIWLSMQASLDSMIAPQRQDRAAAPRSRKQCLPVCGLSGCSMSAGSSTALRQRCVNAALITAQRGSAEVRFRRNRHEHRARRRHPVGAPEPDRPCRTRPVQPTSWGCDDRPWPSRRHRSRCDELEQMLLALGDRGAKTLCEVGQLVGDHSQLVRRQPDRLHRRRGHHACRPSPVGRHYTDLAEEIPRA
jgi:hypothetical protein